MLIYFYLSSVQNDNGSVRSSFFYPNICYAFGEKKLAESYTDADADHEF